MDKIRRKNKNRKGINEIIIKMLWVVVSVLSSLRIIIEDEVVHIDITIFEVLFVNCTTVMLLAGLKNNKLEYLLPWLIFSTWNLFAKKFFALELLCCTYYYHLFGLPAIVAAMFILGVKFSLWSKIIWFVMQDK